MTKSHFTLEIDMKPKFAVIKTSISGNRASANRVYTIKNLKFTKKAYFVLQQKKSLKICTVDLENIINMHKG